MELDKCDQRSFTLIIIFSCRSNFECTPSDSPINFIPEPDPVEGRQTRERGMTLRTRGPLPKVGKKKMKRLLPLRKDT